MDTAELVAVAGRAIELGWRVGIHTVGDRALEAVLTVVGGRATYDPAGRWPR